MSVLELGTRVPLIFRAPWMSRSQGVMTSSLAELVDLYPTLADLANVPLPTGAAAQYLGGTSLKPIFEDPTATVKDVALSQVARCWQNNTHHAPGAKVGDENNHTNSWESMRCDRGSARDLRGREEEERHTPGEADSARAG